MFERADRSQTLFVGPKGFQRVVIGLSPHHAFASLFDLGICGWCAVMERAKEFVPRNFERAVVTLKVPVVHLVVERAQSQPVFLPYNQTLKSSVRGGRGERVILQMKQDLFTTIYHFDKIAQVFEMKKANKRKRGC